MRFVLAHRSDALVTTARIVTHLGDPTVIAVIAVVIAGAMWRTFGETRAGSRRCPLFELTHRGDDQSRREPASSAAS